MMSENKTIYSSFSQTDGPVLKANKKLHIQYILLKDNYSFLKYA